MGYERYPRNTNPQDGYYGPGDPQDYGRDYGSGRDYGYSSARDYRAAGRLDRGPLDRGQRDSRHHDEFGPYGQRGTPYDGDRYSGDGRNYRMPYAGSYMNDGRHDGDYGRGRDYRDSHPRSDRYGYRDDLRRGASPRPEGYSYEDRGFMARAGDELRSWFGDEDAERRRELDQRFDERSAGRHATDDHYSNWRRGQIAALDRDYDEYRRENAGRFETEFGAWRSERQQQRGSLDRVQEHMEVVGSDGAHVGTVDKVRGDRILLTKDDADAGGRHHSIPSRWIEAVDDQVKIRKTADEAKSHWRDEERNTALFKDENAPATGAHMLNRSFSGTY